MSNSININSGLPIYRKVITIPEASVQTMGNNNAYILLFQNSGLILPISCYIQTINSTIDYIGYSHLHLSIGSSPIQELATIQEISVGAITNLFYYSFAMSIRQANRFGVIADRVVTIEWNNIPTAGNGDMKVTIYYTTDI